MVQLATGRRTKCVPIIEPEIKHTREQTEVKLGRELGLFLHGSLLPCCGQMKQGDNGAVGFLPGVLVL